MKRVTITIKGFMFGIFDVLCIAYLCVLCLALVQFSHYVSKCLINGLCYEPLVNVVVCGAVILVLLSLVSAFRRLYRYCNNQGAANHHRCYNLLCTPNAMHSVNLIASGPKLIMFRPREGKFYNPIATPEFSK